MPNISFSFSVSKPITAKRTTNKVFEIVEKNKDGVLTITPSFSYECICDDKHYALTEDSFSCKNKSVIYSQSSYIRIQVPVSERNINRNRYNYAPFRSGSVVRGDIVKNVLTNTMFFKVNTIFVDSTTFMSRECYKYWKDNYEQLEQVRAKLLEESYD